MTMSSSISVTIEIGPGYRANSRLAAAISELQDALHEAHGDDEVSGFAKYDGIDGESNDAFVSWPRVGGNRVFSFTGGPQQVSDGIYKL